MERWPDSLWLGGRITKMVIGRVPEGTRRCATHVAHLENLKMSCNRVRVGGWPVKVKRREILVTRRDEPLVSHHFFARSGQRDQRAHFSRFGHFMPLCERGSLCGTSGCDPPVRHHFLCLFPSFPHFILTFPTPALYKNSCFADVRQWSPGS